MKFTYWRSGDYSAICDVCGFKRKASQLAQRWDGLMVCRPEIDPGCWEVRHPQELIRPIQEQNKLPWTRPESADVFITGQCTGITRQAIAGIGVAGCMIAGLDLGLRNTLYVQGVN